MNQTFEELMGICTYRCKCGKKFKGKCGYVQECPECGEELNP